MAASIIYSQSFLLNDLFKAASLMKRKHNDFAEFQLKSINQLALNFKPEFLTINILQLNKKMMLDGDIVSSVANHPSSVISSYQRHILGDHFTPNTILNPGVALYIDAIKPMDYWVETPIYKNHCTPYSQYWVIGLSYRHPQSQSAFIAFDYMRPEGQPFSYKLTEEYIEYISFPFYLAWLYLHDAICENTLKEQLTLCAETPEIGFHVLRSIVGECIAQPGLLSKYLQRSEGTIRRQIENLYLKLPSEYKKSQQMYINSNGKRAMANRVLVLSQAYRYLSFGEGKIERPLPRR